MEQKLDSYLNGEPDYTYCMYNKDFIVKEEPADYKICEYNLNLSIRAKLSVVANMKVSRSLDIYKMTLYRKYKVLGVTDQDGHKLKYEQKQDYIDIYNNMKYHITNIIISYARMGLKAKALKDIILCYT